MAKEGASYVTLSPIYPTASKPGVPARGPGWLAEAIKGLGIPALALGGMTAARTREVLEAGAWGIAAVSAIGAAPDVELAAREFRNAIWESH
jgi:thiamine-phosphate pyrophosphorylase